MAKVIRPPKQPSDKVWYSIDFSVKDALAAGDDLKTLLYFKCHRNSDGVDVTTALVEINSPRIDEKFVMFKAIGGVHGEDYEYTARVETDFGEELEEDLILQVRES
jgi:hypothetical protein